MIDAHCHLEQKDYDADREQVIEACRKELKAVVNSSPYLPHFPEAVELHNEYKNFVFIALAIHPIYTEEVSDSDINRAITFIHEHKEEISAIGETGLDYYHVKDEKMRIKQAEMFGRFVRLAKELEKPLVIHSRDAMEDTIKILEENGMKNKKVMMHLFESKNNLQRVIDNGWSISLGPNITKSKTRRIIARDMPLDRIMLETDSPWFGFGKRNTPLSIKQVAEEIAKIKKILFEQVWHQAALNAVNFFNLPIKI